MDIFAHTLWAAAGARGINSLREKKHKRLLRVGWTAFWGVFPDFFAFGLGFVQLFTYLIIGKVSFATVEANHHIVPGFSLSAELYNYSHSIVIWAVVFIVVWLISKRPRYELFGWALHILIDIPSHRVDFYPTPFLFPISEYRYPYGVEWSNKWYMILNYSALLLVFGGLLIYRMRKKYAERKAKEYIQST